MHLNELPDSGPMKTISVTELKQHLSQLLHQVHKKHDRFLVTVRGEVVALLVPVPAKAESAIASDEALWTDIDQLAVEIGANWPKGVTAVEAVREDRDRI
jgi:prevent-host-death family protein